MVLNSKDESKQLLQANHLEIYLKLRKKKKLTTTQFVLVVEWWTYENIHSNIAT